MEELDLSDFFHTKIEATDFSIHLASISESIYETGFDLEKALLTHYGARKRDKFIALLRNNKVNIYTASDLEAFFNKIQTRISSLPILSLTIAFEPIDETFKILSDWLALNIHREALLDINIDTKIIGGATVSFNGKYADCSIKPKFDQIFQDTFKNKSEIPAKMATPQENHQSVEHITISR